MALNTVQLAGRTTNYVQHLRGRRLLLERLAEIVRALAQLVEQARVLDGDDGLLGKIAHQLDMLLAEGAYLLAKDHDDAD
jgi:hypothetical protein